MIKFRVEGGRDLAKALDQLTPRVGKSFAREALMDAAEPYQQTASQLAPHEPGAPDLKQNITISPVRAEALATVAVGPAKGFFYGFFQEYGTKHHGAQPFMRPAFDTKTPDVLAKLSAALWRLLAGRKIHRPMANAPTSVQSPGGGGLL